MEMIFFCVCVSVSNGQAWWTVMDFAFDSFHDGKPFFVRHSVLIENGSTEPIAVKTIPYLMTISENGNTLEEFTVDEASADW